MKVSVIIPAINEATNVQGAVKSAQNSGADEVIVVDGGSGDQTRQIAQDAGAIVAESAPGRAVQQNLGAEMAGGDVLVFLHADGRLEPASIPQIRELTQSRHYGAFRQRIDAAGWQYRLIECGNAWRVTWRGLPYGDQAIFISRELFMELGRFPDVPIMEDYLLGKRATRKQAPVLLNGPVITSARRWQQNGVFRQTCRNWALVIASNFGVAPESLATYYPRHDREKMGSNGDHVRIAK